MKIVIIMQAVIDTKDGSDIMFSAMEKAEKYQCLSMNEAVYKEKFKEKVILRPIVR